MEWKNTRAYHNGKSVNPYTFVFRQHLKRNTFFAQILEQISPDINLKSLLSEDPDPEPFLFHKREENRFYFRGIDHAFFLDLKGRMLYEFVDRFDIGDIVYFE